MGTDINLLKMLEERQKISFKILDRLNSWDKDVNNVNKIVKSTEKGIEELKKIDKKLSKYKNEEIYDGVYEENIKKIIRKNIEIMDFIKIFQKKYLEIIKEINKSNKVKNNYLNQKKQPFFVDKNL